MNRAPKRQQRWCGSCTHSAHYLKLFEREVITPRWNGKPCTTTILGAQLQDTHTLHWKQLQLCWAPQLTQQVQRHSFIKLFF